MSSAAPVTKIAPDESSMESTHELWYAIRSYANERCSTV